MLQIESVVGRVINLASPQPGEAKLRRAFVGSEPDVENQYLRMFIAQQSKSTSMASGCAFVAGFVLLLIPVIGWFLGPVFILLSIMGLVAPRAMFKWASGVQFNALQQNAHAAARNAYFNVSCPACGTSWTGPKSAFYFLTDPEGIDCGICKKRIVRRGDQLSVA